MRVFVCVYATVFDGDDDDDDDKERPGLIKHIQEEITQENEETTASDGRIHNQHNQRTQQPLERANNKARCMVLDGI